MYTVNNEKGTFCKAFTENNFTLLTLFIFRLVFWKRGILLYSEKTSPFFKFWMFFKFVMIFRKSAKFLTKIKKESLNISIG